MLEAEELRLRLDAPIGILFGFELWQLIRLPDEGPLVSAAMGLVYLESSLAAGTVDHDATVIARVKGKLRNAAR